MKINKTLAIIILLLTIIIIIFLLKIQKDSTNSNKNDIEKIDIPKIVIPKITIPKTETHKQEDELSKVVSDLQSIIDEEEAIQQDNPTEDEVQNILSNLKARVPPIEENQSEVMEKNVVKDIETKIETLIEEKQIDVVEQIDTDIEKKQIVVENIDIGTEAPIEEKKSDVIENREIKKEIPIITEKIKEPRKKHIAKKIDTIKRKPKEIIIYKEIIVEKPPTKREPSISEEEYRRRLEAESEIDEDIASLSMVETVDVKEVEVLTTPKPTVEQTTIYIPSNDKKIDENIPWAKLQEVDEQVDGILIEESIN